MEETIATSEINITGVVKETINSLCGSLFDSVNNTVFPLLDDIVFINNDITEGSHLEKIFGISPSSGVLILANSLITAFVLYYAVRLFLSHLSGSKIDSPYQFFLKASIIIILMNESLSLCQFMIECTSTFSDFFCLLGKDILGKKISFITLTNELTKSLHGSFNIFSLNGILASTLYISSFQLALNFALRYILVKVLVILAPFAFLCLLNPSTECFFKSWLKSFFSLLFLQVIVALILLLPFAIIKESSSDLFHQLLLIGAITALLKSNQFVRELIGGMGIVANLQTGISGLKSMLT